MTMNYEVIASQEIPTPKQDRMIWQPVTGEDGKKMRLLPLSFQPSGAHAALDALCVENEALVAENLHLRSVNKKLSRTLRLLNDHIDEIYAEMKGDIRR